MTLERTESIHCGHCNNTAPMNVLFKEKSCPLKSQHGSEWIESRDCQKEYTLLQCPVCSNCTLHSQIYSVRETHHDRVFRRQRLYPKIPEFYGVPDAIAREYQSAVRIKNLDADAFATKIGRVLTLICDDKGAKKGRLANRIKELANCSVLPDELRKIADYVRELRNIGAHPELGRLIAYDADILDEMCQVLLMYFYTLPSLAFEADEAIIRIKRARDW